MKRHTFAWIVLPAWTIQNKGQIMGWNQKVKFTNPVTEHDVDDIVAKMPPWMIFKGVPFGFVPADGEKPLQRLKQEELRWSLAVDVRIVDADTIGFHGSCSISGHIAKRFIREFSKMMRNHLDCTSRNGRMSV